MYRLSSWTVRTRHRTCGWRTRMVRTASKPSSSDISFSGGSQPLPPGGSLRGGCYSPRTPQVDHRNVGLDPVHDLEELPAGPGLRHHLDVRRLAKDDPQAHADHRMVVGDDDAHRVMHLISPREASRELSPHSGGKSHSQW